MLVSTKTSRLGGRIMTAAVAVVLSIGLAVPTLLAQSYYATVRGIVVDQNGGVLANTKVTLINEGTSEQRNTTTNNNGDYVFNEVVPATYSVFCESAGFKKLERTNIVVATQASVTVDLKLELGQVTESVQVEEFAPLIESSTASQGQVLDNQKLVDLPNLGRNPFMMSKLSAQRRAGRPARLQPHGRSERLFDDLDCWRPGSRQQLSCSTEFRLRTPIIAPSSFPRSNPCRR